MDHPAGLPEDLLLAECEVCRQRRSGPGGQHRNKVETGIFLRHLPTDCAASATERRSQNQNLRVALRRLRLTMAIDVRSGTNDRPHVPSELWRSRCRVRRIVISVHHADFPTMVAEALDVLSVAGFDLAIAAQRLDCSRSSLVSLLRKDARALAKLNQMRQQAGRRPLR